jgi:hypothetical protein
MRRENSTRNRGGQTTARRARRGGDVKLPAVGTVIRAPLPSATSVLPLESINA